MKESNSMVGFFINGMQDQLNKHSKCISNEKKNLLMDLCLLSSNLSSHFRKTIDESNKYIL